MMPLNYTLEIANLHYINITTVTFKALKNYKLVKKQENMTHSQIKNQLIETDPVMTEMMKLGDKDVKQLSKCAPYVPKI